ncbi:MAG: hypothetical protein LH606_11610 [Cytophagaceae bacterium]|nr:hypothetical protein [Cytophagaceae bacterium]
MGFSHSTESIDQKTLSSYYRVDGELQEGNNIKWRGKRKWCEGQAEPETHESQFCVWPNDRESNKGQSMLETLAGDVLASAEGLGEEYIRLHQFEKGYNIVDKMIIPVIVTNVDLFICKFKPETLDLLSGTLKEENAEVEKVPYIRFRKTLTKSYSEFLGSLRLANKARERTVFIVNVEHLVDFLSKWKSDFWNH